MRLQTFITVLSGRKKLALHWQWFCQGFVLRVPIPPDHNRGVYKKTEATDNADDDDDDDDDDDSYKYRKSYERECIS